MDLAAICVAVLRSVLEYTVALLDITPFLPICLVKYIERVQMRASKDNIPLEALQFAKVARLEDRRIEVCRSTMEIFTKGRPLSTFD